MVITSSINLRQIMISRNQRFVCIQEMNVRIHGMLLACTASPASKLSEHTVWSIGSLAAEQCLPGQIGNLFRCEGVFFSSLDERAGRSNQSQALTGLQLDIHFLESALIYPSQQTQLSQLSLSGRRWFELEAKRKKQSSFLGAGG
ncbi:hypothetical protein NDU88_005008 [Pleurodeles waltl]|uniref:Uncharacterized protein n=1 Tax=Pleurodeles waltl TaxID=8319 RepID=A0AAV7RKS2_PLEWA|nr:hypothetical protein NDU88_005008 [Pleurodeles waltl]